ncbi:MAG TPA: FAD-binding oxidoreductase [Bryobacteraceae bacterium]|nr:FAD-binding oxidoreductase [Bryobacteraceae bacterium]
MDFPKHVAGVVTKRRDITRGLWIVRVHTSEPIRFAPGQYVTVGLFCEEKLVERPYSVASAPDEPELEFFIERVAGGRLTPQLYDVPVGGEVYLRRAAKGTFALDERSGHIHHFMAATVTGIAPFSSMVRRVAEREDAGESISFRLAILQGASSSADLGYAEELAAMAKARKWLDYIPTVSRPWLEPEWKGERGRIEDVARKYLDGLGFTPDTTTAYACGNPHMIRNMRSVLERAGFDRRNVKEETYWPPD